MIEGFPHVYRHTGGYRPCRGIAFVMDRPFRVGEYIISARVRLPDGTQPRAASRMVCGTCGRLVGPSPGHVLTYEPPVPVLEPVSVSEAR